jgi:hypothetical protein
MGEHSSSLLGLPGSSFLGWDNAVGRIEEVRIIIAFYVKVCAVGLNCEAHDNRWGRPTAKYRQIKLTV